MFGNTTVSCFGLEVARTVERMPACPGNRLEINQATALSRDADLELLAASELRPLARGITARSTDDMQGSGYG
jgi:hypothetical protein